MQSFNEINDNERFKNESNNDNDSASKKKYVSDSEAEIKAQYLIDQFKAPGSRLFFLKCAYHLSEYKIQGILETAIKNGRPPLRLFIYLANKELRR